MNRAERRAQARPSATGVVVVRGGGGSRLGTALESRECQRQGDVGQGYLQDKPAKPLTQARPPKEANQRPRAAGGRFAASVDVPGVVALPPALTRQERRAQKRLAAKLAGGWGKITDGKGIVLLNGEEVPGDS